MHNSSRLEQRRRQEHQVTSLTQATRNYNRNLNVAEWEEKNTNVLQSNKAKRRTDLTVAEKEKRIEQKRKRLQQLYQSEDLKYKEELAGLSDTTERRQARLIERGEELKRHKEEKRLAFVDEQLHRQWVDKTDELRNLGSRDIQRNVLSGRQMQLEEKEALRERERHEQAYYASLLEEERQAKIDKEIIIQERERAGKASMVETLGEQLTDLRLRRVEEDNLKRKEGVLQKDRIELEKKEAERLARETERKKAEMRFELDRYNVTKRQQQEQIMQEERERDLAYLQQILEADRDEKDKESRRKAQLREEVHAFRQQIMEQMTRDQSNNVAMDRMKQGDVDKAWNRRMEQWEKEEIARKKLMKEIFEDQKRQIQEKQEANERRKEEARLERQQLEADLGDLAWQDADRQTQSKQEKDEAKQELAHQIGEKRWNKAAEEEARKREERWELEEAARNKQRIQDELDRRGANTQAVPNYNRRKMQW